MYCSKCSLVGSELVIEIIGGVGFLVHEHYTQPSIFFCAVSQTWYTLSGPKYWKIGIYRKTKTQLTKTDI